MRMELQMYNKKAKFHSPYHVYSMLDNKKRVCVLPFDSLSSRPLTFVGQASHGGGESVVDVLLTSYRATICSREKQKTVTAHKDIPEPSHCLHIARKNSDQMQTRCPRTCVRKPQNHNADTRNGPSRITDLCKR